MTDEALAHDPPGNQPALWLVPGQVLVLFFVHLDLVAPACITVAPPRFLDGLLAARSALGFAGLHRAEPSVDELLPWAGNV
jgi:hypothetical protein